MSPRFICALGLMLAALDLRAAALPPVEANPTLTAATLAPASLLHGPGYTVDSRAPVVGYMGQFTLRAPAGVFNADGGEMLAIRVDELKAIAKLDQLSQTGVFADALAKSVANTGTAIGQAVMNPVETLQGIPTGVGRFFESAGNALDRMTQSINGPQSAQSTGPAATADDILGVNTAKRRIARQVGADPYTTNPVLAKRLDDLARAAFTGGVSLDVALAVSTAGAATAISVTAKVSDLVWDRSPEDIRTVLANRLAEMGVDSNAIQAFVSNRWFTPTLAVPFVEGLRAMQHAQHRAKVVALAGNVASEVEARFLLNTIAMARRVGTERDPVVDLELAGRILVLHTRNGRAIVPAPVDFVVWTERVRAFAEKRIAENRRRTILVTGSTSGKARVGLRTAGWTVKEHAAL